ncbi:hypothetical protein FQN57_001505 [Myotisia sp. PD_48]|nr:hypothetical protein FQN57_001505 [Myotisia sp. PD_48]
MATMKAAQWDPAQNKVVVNEVPIPEPGHNQFLTRVKAASLCHSDLMAIDMPRDKPITLGHEGTGVIVKIHPSAEGKGFKVGDGIGSMYFNECCFECDGCKVHNIYCETGNSKCQGFLTDGYFAEYALVDYHNAIILPEQLPLDKCAPLFCAGITAFNALDTCELKPGDWVAMIGCGGLGQLATQYAKAMGLNVIGMDISDKNLAVTKDQGCDYLFNTRTSKTYAEDIKKLTKGGVHAACVFSNAPAAFACAPSVIRLGGTMMVIGIAKEPITFDTNDLATRRYQIKADSTSIPSRMPKAINFTAKHNILPVQQVRKLEEVNDMVNEIRAGTATSRMAVIF